MNLASERRRLIFHVKTAQTPEQVRVLKEAVNAWLAKCSEDTVIESADSELANKEAWLKMKREWH